MVLSQLSFGFRRHLPVTLQTEAAECGLACLAMIAGFYGQRVDLSTLRRKHPVSLKGTTLTHLISVAETMQLATRPLRVELEELSKLRLPCILHWDMQHFVVLKSVRGSRATIHDPSRGVLHVTTGEISSRFTGVALELWPDPGFREQQDVRKLNLRELLGATSGLYRSLLQILILALSLELFGLTAPFLMQWVVDEALVSGDRDMLTTLVLGFGLLLIVQVLISTARTWVLMFMSTSLNVQWSANVFTHLLRLPVQYFQRRHLGDIASRFGSVTAIQSTLTSTFIAGILDGLMSVATLAMMLIYSRTLGLIAIAAMLLYTLCRWASYRALSLATNSEIVFAAKQQSHFLESIRGVKAIKLFQREDLRRATWLGMQVDQINANLRTQKIMMVSTSVNMFLVGAENLLIIFSGGRMVLEGTLTVGMLLAFKAYKDQFDTRVSSLVDKLFQFRLLKLQGARLADIVLTEPERTTGSATTSASEDIPADILISNLRFRYGEHEPFVVNGLNLQISQGESVAITGPSGCGKTTLAHLILGIHEPSAGDILVGGNSVTRVGPDSLRRVIGTVTQDDTLLTGSISDNICFFDPEADQDWVRECAKLAAVHDDIVQMPMGYNSLVGDMGTVLSGGQKQRVLLARALYKRPKILLLDEATSNLDVDREQQVNASIKSLDITRIVIAHRSETIASAARVIKMGGGRIVEDSKWKTAVKMSVNGVVENIPHKPAPSDATSQSESSRVMALSLAPSILRIPG